MYLSTYEERENSTMYEEAYEGRNLSKLHLCDEGKDTWTVTNKHINTYDRYFSVEDWLQLGCNCHYMNSKCVPA